MIRTRSRGGIAPMRSCKEPLRGRGALWWSASSFRPLCGGSHSRTIELLSSRGSRHGYVTDCRSRLTTSFKCRVGITPASASKLGLQEYAKRLCLDVSSLPSIVRSGQAACGPILMFSGSNYQPGSGHNRICRRPSHLPSLPGFDVASGTGGSNAPAWWSRLRPLARCR